MHLIRYAGLILFLLIWILAAGQLPAHADQLILANGDRISGRLITFDGAWVRIETESAGIIQIDRKFVAQLIPDGEAAVDLVSGKGIPSSVAPRVQASMPAETQKPKLIGQKPDDETDIRKIFLRQSAVLLRPGQIEIEAAPSYMRSQSVSPILNAKLRQFRTPISARIGLFNRAEMYVTAPVVFVRQEFAFAENAVSHGEFGIGDASAGLNLELARETARRPDIIAFVGISAPTGSKPRESGLSLGTGHWEASFGAQFIKTVDPVALFAGVYYAHQFESRYFVNDAVQAVNPGETAGYNFGFGFAVNEDISLSAQISGGYQSNARADGKPIFGSSSEPVSLRSALTYRCSKRTYIEPSVAIGLDDETPDFILGISLTHRFGK